ncbi:MAG TPA: c-type cytochrome, partial [Verrucomicrobia bacterium]|nr:c-type cytochrome [Verrucomicrobiota bacterium]
MSFGFGSLYLTFEISALKRHFISLTESINSKRTMRIHLKNTNSFKTIPVLFVVLITLAFQCPAQNALSSIPQATPASSIKTAPGFKVELLYAVPKDEQGSWVSIASLPDGSLITSDQYGGLFHVIPSPLGNPIQKTQVKPLDLEIGHAHGLLWAFDSLYVVVNGKGIGGRGSGLYRVTDADGDGELDTIKLLGKIPGGGEHGPHTVVPTPDGKGLYLAAGNHTNLPEYIKRSHVPRVWQEDHLLPQQADARGHAASRRAPGGWICRTDPEGEDWEFVSVGYRNEFGISVNQQGELFTYDADMEWDFGTPWYRPTRICHVTSGSEFGWRTGTGKWPTHYPDSLPAVLNIGPGSPTAIAFGTGAAFPAAYQNALFALDWTFGTIYAVHLTSQGSSFIAEKEEFITGQPLPVTNLVIGRDGAMYFTIGGRRAQSALYRVTYIGPSSTDPAPPIESYESRQARQLRHRLESYHRPGSDSDAVEFAWRYLDDSDRFIRYAARIAIEHQDVGLWQDWVFEETNAEALIQGVIALARQGDVSLKSRIIGKLNEVSVDRLFPEQVLGLLRAYQLTLIRMGGFDGDGVLQGSLLSRFEGLFPSSDKRLNRELVALLVKLKSPTVISKTLKLLAENREELPPDWAAVAARNSSYGRPIEKMMANWPPLQEIQYAFDLRNLRYGWTLEEREQYFRWFDKASGRSGGASYQGFLKNIRADAWKNTSDGEKEYLTALLDESSGTANISTIPTELPMAKGPGKAWTKDEVLELVSNGLQGRDFENGKKMYSAAICIICHRFDGTGGAAAPDLTSIGGRFGYGDLMESILEPSKVVSDQYASSILTMKDQSMLIGRIVSDKDGKLMISQNPLLPDELTPVNKTQIQKTELSPISLMPPSLIFGLNQDELLDLIAYLYSAGDP